MAGAMSKALIVLCTVPDRFTARRIERTLIDERLAACVNRVGPVLSTFRWEGRMTRDKEWLLVIKTTQARYKELERRILSLHPYKAPEVIAADVASGSSAYLEWVAASVRK